MPTGTSLADGRAPARAYARFPQNRLAPQGGFWYSNGVLKLNEYIGETTSYDKKLMLERKDPTSWLKSVSAFANTQGGKLLFGVANDGSLVGLADAQDDSEFISETIKMQMDPVPEIDLSLHEEDGKRFVVVEIKAGSETPYYTFVKGHRDAYIRIGNESVKATATDIRRLVMKGEHRTFDSLITPYRRVDYSFEILRATYHDVMKASFADSDYVSFGIETTDGFLTNAGALLADNSPIRYSRVFCTRWNGLDKASGVMDAIDDKEFSGGLISLLHRTQEFIAANSKTMWRKTPSLRVEYPEYPERATTECIVNGLMHRDYLELGSEVHVDIFDDRMEITSPGGMIGGRRVQDLDVFSLPSQRRNPVIADVFQRLDLMERRGSGLRKIRDAYRACPSFTEEHMPVFRSDTAFFYVVLPNLNYGHDIGDFVGTTNKTTNNPTNKTTNNPTNKSVGKQSVITLTAEALAVLREFHKDGSASAERVAKILKMTPDGVRYHIKNLRASGRLMRVGNRRVGNWIVVNETIADVERQNATKKGQAK